MIYFLLILAVLAPFAALKLALFLLDSRLNEGVRRNAAAAHHLANAITSVGEHLGEGLRRFGSSFPHEFVLLHQHQAVVADTLPGTDEPLPPDVAAYLSGWGEQWARDEELRYLRGLKAKTGSWDTALKMVLASDNRG